MQCQTCGVILPNGAAWCTRCGAPAATTHETNVYELEQEAIPYIPSRQPVAAANFASVSGTAAAQPAAAMQSQEPPAEEKFASKAPVLTRTGVFLLVLLALLIIGGSGGVLTYATRIHPAELRANATSVAQSIVAKQAQATASTSAQSPQHLYNRITASNPSLSDPLNSQVSSKWNTVIKGTASCTFGNGAYHLRLAASDLSLNCPAVGTNYTNFIYQLQMTIIHGREAGISFRSTSETLPDFTFFITTAGQYSADSLHPIQSLVFGRSSGIHTGMQQTNLLAVMAQGRTISLFINKQYVESVSDSNYTSGEIGVVAANGTGANLDVAFSNAQVWVLP